MCMPLHDFLSQRLSRRSPANLKAKSPAISKDIWVLAEHQGGEWAEVTLELMGEARRLASSLGGGVAALVLGQGVTPLAPSLGPWGADQVYVADHPLLEWYTTEAYLAVLQRLLGETRPQALLLGSTAVGRDLAPRLATRLKTGLVTECVALKVNPQGLLEFTRPLLAGSVYSHWSCPEARPQMATVRPGVIGKEKPDPARQAQVFPIKVDLEASQFRTRAAGLIPANPATVDIAEAEALVVCGRGLGSKDKLGEIQELAEALGAAVAASRPVVDNSWLPYERQIGQTAKTVSPRLLISCGVSGASQHTMGMKDSKFIIAVNTDRAAPIFKLADIAILADMHQFLPALAQRLRQAQAGGQELASGSGSERKA